MNKRYENTLESLLPECAFTTVATVIGLGVALFERFDEFGQVIHAIGVAGFELISGPVMTILSKIFQMFSEAFDYLPVVKISEDEERVSGTVVRS